MSRRKSVLPRLELGATAALNCDLLKRANIAVLAMLIGGCIAIPLGPFDAVAPPIAPVLSEEMRSSDQEVMLIVHSKEGTFSAIDVLRAPIFVKGNALDSVVRKFILESGQYWFGAAVSAAGESGVGKVVYQRIHTLCVVTADGRQLAFFPSDGGWVPIERHPLGASGRDAVLLRLRAHADNPFDREIGPCGLRGKVDWPTQTRARAIEFFATIP